ncbi:MAG TPA: sulfatase-like hydrolase/transferase [Oceanipulchritudo sp.]|nr:sulfatase-like hydrolase/transferase [Oceanipulchritudo sp.]
MKSKRTSFWGVELATSLRRVWLPCLLAVNCLQAERPNIVLIMADDIGTGWLPFHADRLQLNDLEPEIIASYAEKRGRLGEVDPIAHIQAAQNCMPFLDSLAKQGVIFDNCFATASLCAPSRAGLLTGTFQQEWGAYWNKDVDDHGIPADRVVVAEPLNAAGYATAMIGKWHVAKKDPSVIEQIWTEELGESLPMPSGYKGRWKELSGHLREYGYRSSSQPGQHPLDRGFDYYYGFNNHDTQYYDSQELWENRDRVPPRPDGEFLTDLLSEKATRFIESAIRADKPFFLYFAPLTLHGPIVPPPAHYTAQFDTGHKFTNEYAGNMLAMDAGIRQIFAALEANGELDNTLFLFTTDNGCTLYNVPPYNAPNRGGKGTGWFGGLNVPLVIWGKDVKQSGISREIISLADLMPTILEHAGIAVPEGISGKSLIPYLTGKAENGPRDSLSSVSIQSSRWSYFYEGNGENNTRDGDQCPLYAWHFDGEHVFMRVTPTDAGLYESLPDGLPAQVMLYDTRLDRQQRYNLAAKHWEQVEEMDASLREWLAGLEEPVSSQKDDFQMLLKPVEKP